MKIVFKERIIRAFLITDMQSRKLELTTSGATAVVAIIVRQLLLFFNFVYLSILVLFIFKKIFIYNYDIEISQQ